MPFTTRQLLGAVRSQLYFSTMSAWLANQKASNSFRISNQRIKYRLSIPGETYGRATFIGEAHRHDFPPTQLGNGTYLNVSVRSLPRMQEPPWQKCHKCNSLDDKKPKNGCDMVVEHLRRKRGVDDRMQTKCNRNGKHRCDEADEDLKVDLQ